MKEGMRTTYLAAVLIEKLKSYGRVDRFCSSLEIFCSSRAMVRFCFSETAENVLSFHPGVLSDCINIEMRRRVILKGTG